MNIEETKAKVLEILSHGDSLKEDLETSLWLSPRKATIILQDLQKEGLVYKNGNIYTLTPVAPKEPKKRKPKHIITQEKPDHSIMVLRILFGVMSFCGSVLSIRNTSIYLMTAFPVGWALMLSTVMCVFMVASCSAIVLFWSQKKRALAVGLSTLFIIVTLYSMSATTVGMYNSQKKDIVQQTSAARIDKSQEILYNSYEKQEKDIQKLIDAKVITLNRYNVLINGYTSTESKDYKNLSWNISEAEKFIQVRTIELSNLASKKQGLAITMTGVEIEAESFYSMIERLFGIKASMVQFLLSLMASIFVDVITPLGSALALFMRKENK